MKLSLFEPKLRILEIITYLSHIERYVMPSMPNGQSRYGLASVNPWHMCPGLPTPALDNINF